MYFTIEFYENKHFDLSMIDVLTLDCQMLTARASTFLSVAQHGNKKVSRLLNPNNTKVQLSNFVPFLVFLPVLIFHNKKTRNIWNMQDKIKIVDF